MLLNFLWFGLILLSVLADLCSGQPFSSSQAALAGAAFALAKFSIDPLYVFTEWVPEVLVELSSIAKRFWSLNDANAAAVRYVSRSFCVLETGRALLRWGLLALLLGAWMNGLPFFSRRVADVFAQKVAQNAPLRVGQRREQRGADQMRLRGDALRGFANHRDEHGKIALEEIGRGEGMCAGADHRFKILARGEDDDARVGLQANLPGSLRAVYRRMGETSRSSSTSMMRMVLTVCASLVRPAEKSG